MAERIVKGWILDSEDSRDHVFHSSVSPNNVADKPPPRVNMLPSMPAVRDQWPLGACTSFAVGILESFEQDVEPRSPLQIYYDGRVMDGTVGVDAGLSFRTAIKVLAKIGATSEARWPYDTKRFATKPPPEVMADAARHVIREYSRLSGRDNFRQCLAENHPFCIGFLVFESIMSDLTDRSGLVLAPSTTDDFIGAHAVVVAGYDAEFASSDWARLATEQGVDPSLIPEEVYLCRNSWGPDWGRNGNFAIDARYLEDPSLAGDAWTIRA